MTAAGQLQLDREDAGAGELTREFAGELTVRAGDGEGERIIEGIVVPFGQVAEVRDSPDGRRYRETIAPGALDGIDPTQVRLEAMFRSSSASYNTHEGAVLIGRGVEGASRPAGHHMALRASRTPAGDDALTLARDGVLGGLSISFRPVEQRTRADGVIERTRIDVRRVALVERGAYQGATVTAVRADQGGITMHCQHCGAALQAGVGHSCEGTRAAAATAVAAQAPAPAQSPAPATQPEPAAAAAARGVAGDELDRLIATEVERRLTLERGGAEQAAARAIAGGQGGGGLPHNARGQIVITRAQAVYGPGSGQSFFRDGMLAQEGNSEARERLERHYAMLHDVDEAIQRVVGIDQDLGRAGDVLSTEIPGAYPSQYLPGLIVNRVLKQRPMAGFYQRVPIADGLPRIYPVVSTSTSVAVQGAEGTNPAASDFATTPTTVTPLFYGGETKVSRQVLDGADPSTDQMLQTDLTEAYMQASETVVKTAVEAGSTASGVTLTAATPDAGIRGLVINYLGNVFIPPERLFLPTTLTNSWITQNDTTGRPLAPSITPMNSDGSINVNALPIIGQVLTVPVAQSWASTAGTGAGVGGVAVIGRSSDFAIFESNVVRFRYTEGAEAPSAIRIGLWAYLVVGTRRGSRKATGA